ncbi:MAG: hypothetical protein ACTSW1_05410 [Candidatus Hodarchaeales archaeon]
MSTEIIEIKVKELLTHKYCQDSQEAIELLSLCDNLTEELIDHEDQNQQFYFKMLQHLSIFLKSEIHFFSEKMEKAHKSYQKLKSSLSETQTEYPDLYSKWQYHIDRLIHRLDARIQETRARIAHANNDYVQADVLYVETINRYSQELEIEQQNNDYEHYFNTLGNTFRTTGQLYLVRGENNQMNRDFYEAIKNFKKARFLGQTALNDIIGTTRQKTKENTFQRLERQAELLFNQGLEYSEKECYDKAKINYHKAAQVFRALNRLNPNLEYKLQEQIQLSTYYEADAKNLMAQDNNNEAATQFSNASLVLKHMLEKLPLDNLKERFESQIIYFDAMQLYCVAVTEYDNMEPKALDHFKKAKLQLEEVKEKASELNNIPLLNNCIEALKKISSYQEIAKLMFNQEDSENDLN